MISDMQHLINQYIADKPGTIEIIKERSSEILNYFSREDVYGFIRYNEAMLSEYTAAVELITICLAEVRKVLNENVN